MFYFEPFPSAMLVHYLNVNIVKKGFIEGVVQRSPHIIDNARVQRIQQGMKLLKFHWDSSMYQGKSYMTKSQASLTMVLQASAIFSSVKYAIEILMALLQD